MGSYDITGLAADVNMMGYANMEQVASGIHFRLRARTFIVSEPEGKRVVFVNIDACMAYKIEYVLEGGVMMLSFVDMGICILKRMLASVVFTPMPVLAVIFSMLCI